MILDAKGNPITIDKPKLTVEMASYAAIGQVPQILPDPDPVLQKRGDDQTVLAALMADPQVTSLSQLRKRRTLAKGDYGFSPWQPDKGAPPDKRAADLCAALAEDLGPIRLKPVFSAIIDANLYGYTVFELFWRTDGGKLRLYDIAEKPREWFGWNGEGQLFFKKGNDQLIPPYGKFVLARHEPSYQNPYGLRLLSRCLWAVTFKQAGTEWYLRFLERYGMPWQVATAPQSYDQKKRKHLAESLASMVQDAVAVLPFGSEHSLVTASGDAGTGYIDFLNFWNAEIAKVLSCQTQSSELAGKTGSYASSQTHYEVLEDVSAADEGLIRDTMNDLAVIYATLNGQQDCPPVFEFLEAEDYKAQAELDQLRYAVGVRFTKAHFQRYGLEEDEFDVAAVQETVGAAFCRPPNAFCRPPNGTPGTANGTPGTANGTPRTASPTEFAAGDADVVAWQNEIDAFCSRVVAGLPNRFDGINAVIAAAASYEGLEEALANLAGQPLDEAETAALHESLLAGQLAGMASVGDADFADGRQNGAPTPWNLSSEFAAFRFDPLPPVDALQFWRNKVPMPPGQFNRLSAEMKTQAFTVSGVARLEDIATVQRGIERALVTGQPLAQFQSDMTARFDGKLSTAKLDNIYRTNIQSAYQTGRYAQMSRVSETMPWWRYVAVQDQRTRPEHKALHGIIRRFDDPFWQTRYPPNGFRCRCTVRPMSDAQVKRSGYDTGEGEPDPVDVIDEVTGEVTPVIGQADEGWRLNAGKACWQPDLGKFRADLKQNMLESLGLTLRADPLAWPQIKRRLKQADLDDMETVLWSRDTAHGQAFGGWVDDVLETRQPRGELYPVGNLPLRVLRQIQPQPRLALVTIDDQRLAHMARDVKNARGAALTAEEIKAIPAMLQNARWFRDTTEKHRNIFMAWMRLDDGKWLKVVVQPDYKLGTDLVANNIVTAGVTFLENLEDFEEL